MGGGKYLNIDTYVVSPKRYSEILSGKKKVLVMKDKPKSSVARVVSSDNRESVDVRIKKVPEYSVLGFLTVYESLKNHNPRLLDCECICDSCLTYRELYQIVKGTNPNSCFFGAVIL